MLHFAGFSGGDWFFNNMKDLDYDIIAVSYYPLWHGKNLDSMQEALTNFSTTYNKDIVIAETSYPFTFGYNDYTSNVISNESQILT